MHITKFGHCCLVIKHKGVTIMTDPGGFSSGFEDVKGVDIILLTHEHQDHLHIESLGKVLKNNPEAKIITNSSVGKILATEHILYQVVEDAQSASVNEILFEGFGSEHAEIFGEAGRVQNTGYLIDNIFFYPGDAFYNPKKAVDILAVPMAGPWMALKEAIRYVKEVKPRVSFPVHDAVLSEIGKSLHARILGNNTQNDTKFVVLEQGKGVEL